MTTFPENMKMTFTESVSMIIKSMSYSTCLPDPLTLQSCDYRIDIKWRMFPPGS
ncbi:hypothetical protein NC652_022219 [Populus alba x Populus x berolinensis]|nr:hypothetical protein NC652_022219 [Populus alba x Populus x berolinensis]